MPKLLILNQMAGPMTWELAEDAADLLGCVALLTGHPDTLDKAHDGVFIFAAAPYQRGSFVRRAVSWLRYAWQALWWLCKWPGDIPVLLFSNPPILSWVSWFLQLVRGQRYTIMVHDIYPDVLVRLAGYSEHHLLIKAWRWLNRHAYERADCVMTLHSQMAANLEGQFDSCRTKAGCVRVIPPWVDTDVIKPIPKEENWFVQQHGLSDKVTVMYSGNMGLGHDIESMLKAAIALRGERRIHFMFIGAGPKWDLVNETIKSKDLTNVTLLEWQPEGVLPYQLAAADIGLVSLEPELRDLAIPSKALYMMAAGCAILALAPQPSTLDQLIEQASAGVTVQVEQSHMLWYQLQLLLAAETSLLEMKMAAECEIRSHFSRTEISPTIISAIRDYCEKSGARPRKSEAEC